MWKITDLDYETAPFTNAEAREGAGVTPALWAKWKERGLGGPSRTLKGGRAGQYSPKRIFEMKVMSVVVQETSIPVSEAKEIAALAVKGSWNIDELRARPRNWRSCVIRDNPPPLDVFLVFSRTENCWGFDVAIGPPRIETFKNSASLVLAAARELTAVSKFCWHLLQETGRTETA